MKEILIGVISGHSHRPSAREMGGVLFLNPGSAGPRRFGLPVSVARVSVWGKQLQAALVELDGEATHD
jgi:predicted phosphodiesterase